MSVGAPPHESPATKTDYTSYRHLRLCQKLDQLVKRASNKSMKAGVEGSVRGRKPVSAWRYRGGRERSSREQKRRDDRGMEEQRARLYPGQAEGECQPQSGGAKPEEAAHGNLDHGHNVSFF